MRFITPAIWDGSQRHTDVKAGVLTLFTGGQEVAVIQDAKQDGERILSNVAKGLPMLAQEQTGRFYLTTWHQDAEIGGSYTNFAPGQSKPIKGKASLYSCGTGLSLRAKIKEVLR